MAGFGAVIGGALEGWGSARLDQLKAEREAKLRSLERQEDRDWQVKRDADERKFRSDEAAMSRDFTSKENEKTRAANADILTTESGDSVVRDGSGVKPLTDKDGKPVRLASGTKDKPAEVSTAEWLVQNGVASDAASAWRMVRSAKSDPEKSRASIYKSWMTVLKPEFGNADGEALQAEAELRTQQTLDYLNKEDEATPDGGKSADSTPAPAGTGELKGGMVRKGGYTVDPQKAKENATKEADMGTAANIIPSNPADRVPNKIYMLKGKMYRWMVDGDQAGWEPVK